MGIAVCRQRVARLLPELWFDALAKRSADAFGRGASYGEEAAVGAGIAQPEFTLSATEAIAHDPLARSAWPAGEIGVAAIAAEADRQGNDLLNRRLVDRGHGGAPADRAPAIAHARRVSLAISL